MSSYQRPQQTDVLTIGDRLNYTYLLMKSLLGIQTAIQAGEYSEHEVIEATYLAKSFITTELEDEEYRGDLKKAVYEVQEDNRPTWCGVPIGGDIGKKVVRYDYYKLIHAMMDLLNRRNKLWRETMKEIADGSDYVPENADSGQELPS